MLTHLTNFVPWFGYYSGSSGSSSCNSWISSLLWEDWWQFDRKVERVEVHLYFFDENCTEYLNVSILIWFVCFSIKMTGKIIRPAPAEIEYRNMGRNMRFLITDQPQVRSVPLSQSLLISWWIIRGLFSKSSCTVWVRSPGSLSHLTPHLRECFFRVNQAFTVPLRGEPR